MPAMPANRFKADRLPMIFLSPLFSGSPVNSGVKFSQQSIKPPAFLLQSWCAVAPDAFSSRRNPARQLKYRNNLKTQLEKPCHAARAIIKSAQLTKPFRSNPNQNDRDL